MTTGTLHIVSTIAVLDNVLSMLGDSDEVILIEEAQGFHIPIDCSDRIHHFTRMPALVDLIYRKQHCVTW